MKKKILLFLGIFAFVVGMGFSVHAEETNTTEPTTTVETTEPTSSEMISETLSTEIVVDDNDGATENVDFETQLEAFADKWIQVIFSALASITGTASVVGLAWKVIKKLKEQGDKDSEKFIKAEKIFNDSKQDLDKQVDDLKNLIPQMQKEFVDIVNQYKEETQLLRDTVTALSERFDTASELIGILVSTSPEMANNGISKQVLELLSTKEVKDNEQK